MAAMSNLVRFVDIKGKHDFYAFRVSKEYFAFRAGFYPEESLHVLEDACGDSYFVHFTDDDAICHPV